MVFQFALSAVKAQDRFTTQMLIQDTTQEDITVAQTCTLIARTQPQFSGGAGGIQHHTGLPAPGLRRGLVPRMA